MNHVLFIVILVCLEVDGGQVLGRVLVSVVKEKLVTVKVLERGSREFVRQRAPVDELDGADGRSGQVALGPLETIAYIQLAPESITLVTGLAPHTTTLARHNLEIAVTALRSGQQMTPLTFPGRTDAARAGRYQIGGLQPESWYGIVYRDSVSAPFVFRHADHRVLRTLPRSGPPLPSLSQLRVYRLPRERLFVAVQASASDLATFHVLFQATLNCAAGLQISRQFLLTEESSKDHTVGMLFQRFSKVCSCLLC